MTTVKDMFYHMGGVPVGGSFTTGNVFFVHHNGSNSKAGTDKDNPVATLDYAIGLVTASNGDIIYIMPGHAETTTAIAADIVGLDIRGLGHGASRPTITATTAATDLINVTASSVRIDNINLTGAASGCTALIDLSAAADHFRLSRCRLDNVADPTDVITIAPTADRGIIEDCQFIGTADIDMCIAFENATAGESTVDWIIRRCHFNVLTSGGCDEDCINITVSSGGVTGILIEDCTFIGLANGEAAINPQGSTAGRATGLVNRCSVHGADAPDAFVESDLLGYVQCYAAEPGTKPFASHTGSGMTPLLTANASN